MKAILLLILVTGCAHMNGKANPLTPHVVGWVTIYSPADRGWQLFKKADHTLIWGKIHSYGAEFSTLGFRLLKDFDAKSFEDTLHFRLSRRAINDNEKAYQLLELRNVKVSFLGLPCVKYFTMAKVTERSSFFKTSGYFCQPKSEGLAPIHLEIAEQSSSQVISEDLMKIAHEFFHGLQINR